ncbi:MAG TPA: HDOD domain-containing protein, partial [Thiotrichales bacterium]|nr:HDOD domain-containing protein [Thiotrichales bacterium]
MNEKAQQFLETLKQTLANDELQLPTLPEVALKIRDTVESEDSSAQQVADIMSQDASLCARLVQVANSPMYRGNAKVDDIQTAVARLGMKMVRDLVIRLAMKQMFQATSDALDKHFRRSWNTAVEVAAISRMLAGTVAGVNP